VNALQINTLRQQAKFIKTRHRALAGLILGIGNFLCRFVEMNLNR